MIKYSVIKSVDFSKPNNFSDNNLLETAQVFFERSLSYGEVKVRLGFDCSGFIQTVYKKFWSSFYQEIHLNK